MGVEGCGVVGELGVVSPGCEVDGGLDAPVDFVVPGGAEDIGGVTGWLEPADGVVGPLVERDEWNEWVGPRFGTPGLAPRFGGAPLDGAGC